MIQMKTRTVLLLALLCTAATVISLGCTTDSEASSQDVTFLLDYGNGQTVWYEVDGDTVGEAIGNALHSAGIGFVDNPSISIDGKTTFTIGDTVCKWQFYVYNSGWVATTYNPNMAYNGENIAIGFYPEGYCPTVTPAYKNAWTCIHGDALNSCNTNDYDPTWGSGTVRATYYNDNVPACYSSPLAANGIYYQMSRDFQNPNIMTTRHLIAMNMTSGNILWDIPQRGGQYELATGAIYGGNIYYSTIGTIYSIPLNSTDPESEITNYKAGASILNTKTTVMIGTSSIVYDSGHLFFGGSDGVIHCITPDLKLVWKTQLTGGVYPSMSVTVTNGLIYVGTCNGRLVILDEATGEIQDSLELYYDDSEKGVGGRVNTPAVIGDTIMVSYGDGAGMSAVYWAYAILHYDRNTKTLTLEHNLTDLSIQTNAAVISPISECVYTSANNVLYRIYTDGACEEVFGHEEVHGGFTFVNNTYLIGTAYDAKSGIIAYNMSGDLVGKLSKNNTPISNYTMCSTAVVGGFMIAGSDSGSMIVRGLLASGEDQPDPEHYLQSSHTITWKQDDGTVLDVTHVKDGVLPTHIDPLKSPSTESVYTFIGWSPEIVVATGDATYTASYSSSPRPYLVEWYNGDTLLKSETLTYGSTPSYTGDAPTKASDAQYSYTFTGWNPAVSSVTGNIEYYAEYSKTTNKYTISWLNEDSSLIYSESIDYGVLPTYTGETPAKDPVGGVEYEFDGWSPYIKTVTEAAQYTAVFSPKSTFSVTWTNYNGDILEIDRGLTGEVIPSYDGDTPTRESTAEAIYNFSGWSPNVGTITESTTYVAQFELLPREYEITWYVEDVLVKSETLEYSTLPEYSGAEPTKPSTAEFYYTFAGWEPEIIPVNGNARYDAFFKQTPREYNITYKVNGSTEYTATGTYGETYALREIEPKEGYRSTGWTSEQVDVSGTTFSMPAKDVIFSREEIQVFTITWIWNTATGTSSGTTTVDVNTLPEHSDPPLISTPEYTYKFDKWSPDLVVATENATYTATYTTQPTAYTLSYYVNGKLDGDTSTEYYGQTVTIRPFDKDEGYIYSEWSGDNVTISDTGTFTMPASNVKLYRTVTKETTDESSNTVWETTYNYHDNITVTVTDVHDATGAGTVTVTAESSDGTLTSTTKFARGSSSAEINVNVPFKGTSADNLSFEDEMMTLATFMVEDMNKCLPEGVTADYRYLSATTDMSNVEMLISSDSMSSMSNSECTLRITTNDCSITISPSVIQKHKSNAFSLSMKAVGSSEMTDDQRKAVSENATVLNIKAQSGTTDIGSNLGGRMLITINHTIAGKELVAYYLPESGSPEKLELESYTDTTATFYVDHLSLYAVDEKPIVANPDSTIAIILVLAIVAAIMLAFLLICNHRAKAERMSLVQYLKAILTGKTGGSKIKRNKRRLFVVCLLGFLLTLFMFFLNIAVGPSVTLPFFDAISALISAIGKGGHDLTIQEIIVYETRLPRALAAVAVGIGLSIAGCVYQAIIRNPLVDPYIMGVSSGAGTFAVAAISANFTFFGLLAANSFSTPILAAIGGLTAFGLTLVLAEKAGGSSTNYVLAGVVVGLVFSAIQTLLLVTSSNEHLTSAISWLFGSFANVGWGTVWMIFFPAVFLSLVPLFWAKELNLVLLGEDQAKQMGLNVRLFNRWMLILASVLTSVCVAFVGIIGFVGMVIPHLSRMMLGGDHRLVLPASVMMGGALMLFADFMAKMLMIPTELPVGAITTIIGVPVFAYLLIKKGRMYDG